MKRPRASQGFTLIELMVVLAILLVLAALAYPTYSRHVVKARRAEARAALMETMQKQERHFTRHNSYVAFSSTSSAESAKLFRWWSGARPATSAYELQGETCADQPIERCIVLKAIPGTGQVDSLFRDADCGTLVLHSSGVQQADGAARECWP